MRRTLTVFFVFAVVLWTELAYAQNTPPSTSSERKVTTRVEPTYPELAKKIHLHGVVRVEAIVRPNGTVKTARALGGNPVLVDAAVEAVAKWKFEPALIETTQIVQVTFDAQ